MRIPTGKITQHPYKDRKTCANNHPWTIESTRWRARTRINKHGNPINTIERDCLICKQVSEGKRRKKRLSERTYH